MAISTINTSTAGRITDWGTEDTVAAPKKDMAKAAQAAGITKLQSITTLRTKDRATNAVPQAVASLLVPSNATGCVVGSTLNNAGTWISPPPPTAASIRPAAKANTQRMTISTMESGSDDERLVRGQRHLVYRVVDLVDARHPAVVAIVAGGKSSQACRACWFLTISMSPGCSRIGCMTSGWLEAANSSRTNCVWSQVAATPALL